MNPPFTVLRVHSLNCITFVVLTNNYGHPAAEIIKNYMDNRITVIRSDLQGAAGFRCERGKVKSAVMCDGNSRQ